MKYLAGLVVLAGSVLVAQDVGGVRSQHRTVEQRSVAEQYLFEAANAERAQMGLVALRWDSALYRAADDHAREMAKRESISHQYPGEAELSDRVRSRGARFSVVSENVAEASTAVRIHDAWMHSEGHRANLLDSRVDSVGIRVLERNGQLYAVEDFDRAVADVSFAQQEATVAAQLRGVTVLPTTDEARKTCAMDTGYAGSRKAVFVMRYTGADLTQVPEELQRRVASGKYHEAMVGACSTQGVQAFTLYSVAVLLYP